MPFESTTRHGTIRTTITYIISYTDIYPLASAADYWKFRVFCTSEQTRAHAQRHTQTRVDIEWEKHNGKAKTPQTSCAAAVSGGRARARFHCCGGGCCCCSALGHAIDILTYTHATHLCMRGVRKLSAQYIPFVHCEPCLVWKAAAAAVEMTNINLCSIITFALT